MVLGPTRCVWQALAVPGLLALLVVAAASGRGAEQRKVDTASAALACARIVLGGSDALSAVSSLAVTFTSTPDPASKRGRAFTNEITLGFPDKYRSFDRLPLPNGREMVSVRGFSGDKLLAGPADENVIETSKPGEDSLRMARREFARWALALLLRETAATPLTWSRVVGSDGAFLRIAATGPDDFNLALLLNKATCQPVAAIWDRPPNFGDVRSGRTPNTVGRHVVRYDLMDYETFQGVRLPTRIRTSTDGIAGSELKVTSARVNQPLPDALTASPHRKTGGSTTRR